MRRALILGWAGALAIVLAVAPAAHAKNDCLAACVQKKKAAFVAAQAAFKACKTTATDAAGKKACKTERKAARTQALTDFKTAKPTCKSDKTSAICSAASPSGAFLD